MKIFKIIVCAEIVVFVFILGGITFGDNFPYKRIGNTNFYLIESYAISKDGHPLACLYYKYDNAYEGVRMSGFPLYIMWNEDYIITKNYDGKKNKIISYNIIESLQTDKSYMPVKVYEFSTKSAYHIALRNLGIDEKKINCTDNHLPWFSIFDLNR